MKSIGLRPGKVMFYIVLSDYLSYPDLVYVLYIATLFNISSFINVNVTEFKTCCEIKKLRCVREFQWQWTICTMKTNGIHNKYCTSNVDDTYIIDFKWRFLIHDIIINWLIDLKTFYDFYFINRLKEKLFIEERMR